MKGYLDPMIDIAEQLCLKWERLNRTSRSTSPPT